MLVMAREAKRDAGTVLVKRVLGVSKSKELPRRADLNYKNLWYGLLERSLVLFFCSG
jgi:hypothetical protein